MLKDQDMTLFNIDIEKFFNMMYIEKPNIIIVHIINVINFFLLF